jgi:hypothetical protein
MRTKINKLKKALIAQGDRLTFSEGFNQTTPEIRIHGFYKNEYFGFDINKGIAEVWSTLNLEAKENTINLLKEYKLWQE